MRVDKLRAAATSAWVTAHSKEDDDIGYVDKWVVGELERGREGALGDRFGCDAGVCWHRSGCGVIARTLPPPPALCLHTQVRRQVRGGGVQGGGHLPQDPGGLHRRGGETPGGL